jgi:cytochrome c oxidase subunit 2
MWDFPLVPEQASTLAARVDRITLVMVGVCLFFTAAICFLILSFAVKYRRGSAADRSRPATRNLKLEIAWIAVPLAGELGVFVWATIVYFHLYRPPRDAFEVYVLGRQWMWELRHPEGKREINELHVPLNRPVRLTMTSQDVIHSFYVPAFRIKQDVVPGRYTSAWFQPTRLGRYHLFCAEYCGTKHSGMIGWVVVLEPSEYQQWLEGISASALTASPTMALEGERLFRQFGCSGCHSPRSTIRAPLLDGVYGNPVPLQGGGIVTADERYIRDSILLPRKEVVAGFEPVMPTFEGQVREDQLLSLIAYIKSLARDQGSER